MQVSRCTIIVDLCTLTDSEQDCALIALSTGYLQNKHDWYPAISVDRLKYTSSVDTLLEIFGMIHVPWGMLLR